tara:strand:- start:4468 stop:5181 length:714 start_codon:yes stop_codon:yes gene_type:complete
MQVVILCGGKGERLREKTETIPKPLVEIGDKPILWHIMKIYSHYDLKDFILCLGYKGEKIKDFFSSGLGNTDGWNITFVDTGLETNTGGRIKKIEKYINDETFLATYGDGVSDINISQLIDYHRKYNKTATVTCIRPRSNFGILKINDNNIITTFEEKPFIDQWINGGFFVLNKKIFGYLDENSILETETVKKLISDGEITAYKYDGFWECMDTYKDTRVLNKIYACGNAKWMVWEK